MQFRVLGSVAVSDDNGEIRLGGSRERLVLAHLLVRADRRVTSDSLIEALWAKPPATARQQLQNLVAGLRRRLGHEGTRLLQTRPLGYELQLGGHWLDLLEFRRLVSAARYAEDEPAQVVTQLRRALAHWRGTPMSDATPATPDAELGAVIEGLLEERVAATELLVKTLNESGAHDEVLAITSVSLADDPWNERLHEHRLRALAATGRRTEAGEAFRRLRRQFVKELGIEPGGSLAALNTRILEGAPMTAPAPTRAVLPRELPPMAWTLVGREALLSALVDRLSDAAPRPAGRPLRMELLAGVGGVGKTVLAIAAGHAVSEQYPDGTLYAALGDGHRGAADSHDVLGRFLRALGVDDTAIPVDPEERIALYRSHTAGKQILVVLDNAMSENQVRRLLPTSPGAAALITSRSKLASLSGTRRTVVEPLDQPAGVALLEDLSSRTHAREDADLLGEIVGLCGHLPLALCVVGSKLASNASLDLQELRDRLADQRTRLDELSIGDIDVRASIAASIADLPAAASTLLGRLAVCPPGDWPGWIALRLMDDDRQAARRALDDLIDRHLVEPLGRDGAGQPRFRMHPLIGEFAYAHLGAQSAPAEITVLSTRIAASWLALSQHAAGLLEPGPALHPVAPGSWSDPAVFHAVSSAPFEFFEAERINLQSAVLDAVANDERELAAAIALACKGFLAIRGYEAERERLIRTALDDYPATADQRLSLRLLAELFRTLAAQHRTAELAEVARRSHTAAQRLADAVLQRRAMAQLAWVAMKLGRFSDSLDWLTAMESSARATGDDAARIAALGQRGVVLRNIGQTAEGDALLDEIVAETRRTGSKRDVGIWLTTRAEGLTELGRTREARELVSEALRSSTDLHDDVGAATCRLVLARVDLTEGDLEVARTGLDVARQTLDARATGGQDPDCLRLEVDLGVAERLPESAAGAATALVAARRVEENDLQLAADLARAAVALATADAAAAERAKTECDSILDRLGLSRLALRLPAAYASPPAVSELLVGGE